MSLVPEAITEVPTRSYRISSQRLPLANLPLGASRFGGSPDVPIGFDWPVHRGRPLTFLAQLALTELQTTALPVTGWLLFFYDAAEQPMGFDPLHTGGAKVVYVDVARDDLRRIEHPDVTSAGGQYESCALSITKTVDLPGCAGEPYHQLLGQPQLGQGDMRGECQLVTNGFYCGDPSGYQGKRAQELLMQAAEEWQLLLQLDTDEAGPDWEWGDSGRLYFWIRRTDLAARAFEKAWLILQCGE